MQQSGIGHRSATPRLDAVAVAPGRAAAMAIAQPGAAEIVGEVSVSLAPSAVTPRRFPANAVRVSGNVNISVASLLLRGVRRRRRANWMQCRLSMLPTG